MYKMPKNVQKSVRMTEKIFNYVDNFNGAGFNEKFENLVLYFMEQEERVASKIKLGEDRLKDIEKDIIKQGDILRDLRSVEYSLSSLLRYSEMAFQNCSSRNPDFAGSCSKDELQEYVTQKKEGCQVIRKLQHKK